MTTERTTMEASACNMALRSAVFEVLRRHDVGEQCFAEVAAITHAALTTAQTEAAALIHDLEQSMDTCTHYVNECARLETEAAAKDARIAELDGEVARLKKMAKENLGTMQEQKKRFGRHGLSACELDIAIEDTRAALSDTQP